MHLPRLARRTLGLVAGIALLVIGPTAATALAAGGPNVTEYSVNGTAVTLGGAGLSEVTGVTFGTTSAISFKVVSDAEVDAVAPDLPVGYHEIFVVTASGTTDTGFRYLKAPPAPTITSLSVDHGTAAGGTPVTVKGTNFSLIRYVFIDGVVSNYSVVSNTQINLVTAPHAAGTVQLSITTLGGTAQHSFSFDAVAPRISSVTPNHGFIGGNTKVTINGSNFTNVKSVKFGTTNAKSFIVVSPTQITAISPQVSVGGQVRISVATNAGTATSSPWTYNYVKPWITSVSPTSGSTSSATVVTINGSGFTGVTSVKVGDTFATIKTLGDKQLVATVPAHAAGSVSIAVTNPAGTSNTATYKYQ